MKISPSPAPARPVDKVSRPTPVAPPVALDAMGIAWSVINAPTTDEAWLALTDRTPSGGHYLAARLTACSSRVDEATTAVAKALGLVGERRRTNPPVPDSWVKKLAELVVEEFDALVAWDDVAHQAALVCPAWVEVPPGERAIDPGETSWARISRVVAREIALVGGMELSDEAYSAHCALDATRPCEGSDLQTVTDGCRAAIRAAVRAHYGQKEKDS